MINENDFEDKAAKLMNRLAVATSGNRPNQRNKVDTSKMSVH